MKRTLLLTLLLAGAAFCVFAQSGVIREFSGEVSLKPAGRTAFVAAKVGDTVATDTIVSTGFKSTAIIQVGNTTITVRPLTRLSLAEIKADSNSETLNVNLQSGRVKLDVKPPAGTKANCSVQSPSATASVRGTSFEFDTLNLTVGEGIVAFRGSKGNAVMVAAGAKSSVGTDGTAAEVTEAIEAELVPPAPVGADSIIKTSSSRRPSGGLVWIRLN